MHLMLVARVAGVLGGLAWVVRHVADVEALRWPGLILLAVALAAYGAGLVSRSATWLRAIVALCLPLLVWSVVEVAHGSGDDSLVDAVTGAAVALVSLAGMVRARAARQPAGAHAA
ncbi:hypothetical protein [Nocardioides sp. cx-173]|uniref:hypothetical protein n=1 Tax=Nocardioides sp. cx-173 TaxID=2898796 RepID=UPI001E410263|nr:hypothetical protein [Nocardioides sp. cx-173]MCD4526535.1 hypothetical protein [Nocardioides sp. cx-173]UGB41222.1 hypothetical protein LQ940_17860 [Nocardioides sp. cx-173]